ncbi:MAG TPA: efflux RND transporter periplasmic adaptor subunit [Kofleriaceae bacterium]|nr:efflux RND transporter periplasmic adaptor subunit [Kofleriaceae bacterium]
MTDSVLTAPPPAAVREARRVRIVTVALVGALAAGALVFHQQLIGWFGGTQAARGATSSAAQVVAGGLSIETALQPDPPTANGNRAHVQVRDAAGKPVTGATVRLEFDMPAMGAMQAMHGGADATEDGDGRYTIRFDLGMDGSWTVAVKVASAAGNASARYTLRTGSSGLIPLGGEAAGSAAAAPAYYTCSMHTEVHSATPGKCPICSMDLVPVAADQAHPGTIQIDEHRRALLGIRTTKVTRAPIDLEITAKGRLTYDETRLHEITLKVGGYVSDLRVNAAGQAVHKGDTLFTLYSPELYAAEQEYLIARQNADVMRAGDPAHGDLLSRAAETKLRLWDFGDEQLRALAASGTPLERVPFRSPASGVVIEKNLVDGAAVMAGQRLFRIADLDQIWVEADVYEADLPRITKGMTATITLSYLPGKTFDGKVAFVYPYLDPASRTGRVRIALPNKGLELKPDMYANATFQIPLGPRLTVPTSAVIYTGPRRLVFVDAGGGALHPQEVTIGARTGDRVEIVSGLDEGDLVVSSGNFLVAAESRVRSAASFWEDDHAGH